MNLSQKDCIDYSLAIQINKDWNLYWICKHKLCVLELAHLAVFPSRFMEICIFGIFKNSAMLDV